MIFLMIKGKKAEHFIDVCSQQHSEVYVNDILPRLKCDSIETRFQQYSSDYRARISQI